jgi:hypothetical protein
MPASVVDAPISYALAPALTALERAVPKRFGDFNKRLPIPGNTRQHAATRRVRGHPHAVRGDVQR